MLVRIHGVDLHDRCERNDAQVLEVVVRCVQEAINRLGSSLDKLSTGIDVRDGLDTLEQDR